MKWEFLGTQSLLEAEPGKKGYTYRCSMWRTPVPGGWLIMTLNAKSNTPEPMQSFYPDPDHVWTGKQPVEANYLLRAAGNDNAVAALPSPPGMKAIE